MRVKISKTGKNDRGIWIYGVAECGGLDIYSVFSTNLKDLPKSDSTLEFKKVNILNIGKKVRYELEF